MRRTPLVGAYIHTDNQDRNSNAAFTSRTVPSFGTSCYAFQPHHLRIAYIFSIPNRPQLFFRTRRYIVEHEYKSVSIQAPSFDPFFSTKCDTVDRQRETRCTVVAKFHAFPHRSTCLFAVSTKQYSHGTTRRSRIISSQVYRFVGLSFLTIVYSFGIPCRLTRQSEISWQNRGSESWRVS